MVEPPFDELEGQSERTVCLGPSENGALNLADGGGLRFASSPCSQIQHTLPDFYEIAQTGGLCYEGQLIANSAAAMSAQVMDVDQAPKYELVKAVPLERATYHWPFDWIRPAMSDLPSPSKSPTRASTQSTDDVHWPK